MIWAHSCCLSRSVETTRLAGLNRTAHSFKADVDFILNTEHIFPDFFWHFKTLLVENPHQSRSFWVQCHHRGGGRLPGSHGFLCPAQQSESGSCCRRGRWFPTHTQCHLGTSSGNPERTKSRWLGPAHWGHSHHLQGKTCRLGTASFRFSYDPWNKLEYIHKNGEKVSLRIWIITK